jgi:hypothetical protein
MASCRADSAVIRLWGGGSGWWPRSSACEAVQYSELAKRVFAHGSTGQDPKQFINHISPAIVVPNANDRNNIEHHTYLFDSSSVAKQLRLIRQKSRSRW